MRKLFLILFVLSSVCGISQIDQRKSIIVCGCPSDTASNQGRVYILAAYKGALVACCDKPIKPLKFVKGMPWDESERSPIDTSGIYYANQERKKLKCEN